MKEGLSENSIESKKYPTDFIERVKAEFPDWKELHSALDSGNEFVGRYLDDSRGLNIDSEGIIKAFENGEQEKILEMAKKEKRINDLYGEWLKIDSLNK